MNLRDRNMLFAPRVPLAFKPKPVELARFLTAGTTGREDYTGSLTVSPSHKLVSPVTTPDAGSINKWTFLPTVHRAITTTPNTSKPEPDGKGKDVRIQTAACTRQQQTGRH
jgi:hypothetical protein